MRGIRRLLVANRCEKAQLEWSLARAENRYVALTDGHMNVRALKLCMMERPLVRVSDRFSCFYKGWSQCRFFSKAVSSQPVCELTEDTPKIERNAKKNIFDQLPPDPDNVYTTIGNFKNKLFAMKNVYVCDNSDEVCVGMARYSLHSTESLLNLAKAFVRVNDVRMACETTWSGASLAFRLYTKCNLGIIFHSHSVIRRYTKEFIFPVNEGLYMAFRHMESLHHEHYDYEGGEFYADKNFALYEFFVSELPKVKAPQPNQLSKFLKKNENLWERVKKL